MNWYKKFVLAARKLTWESVYLDNGIQDIVGKGFKQFKNYITNPKKFLPQASAESVAALEKAWMNFYVAACKVYYMEQKDGARYQELLNEPAAASSSELPTEEEMNKLKSALADALGQVNIGVRGGGNKFHPELAANDIFMKYISPGLMALNPSINIKATTFWARKSRNPELKAYFDSFVQSLIQDEQQFAAIPEDQKQGKNFELGEESKQYLNQIIDICRTIILNEFDYPDRMNVGEEKPDSYHEFAIGDIFYIMGVNFESQKDVLIDMTKIPADFRQQAHEYIKPAKVDFVVNGEILELLGDISRGDYAGRKISKLYGWDHFWFVDFAKNPVNDARTQRKLESYANRLDTCCLKSVHKTANSDSKVVTAAEIGARSDQVVYPPQVQCGQKFQGRDHYKELTMRIPLLSPMGLKLCDSYLLYLQNLSNEELGIMRARARWLNSIPHSLSVGRNNLPPFPNLQNGFVPPPNMADAPEYDMEERTKRLQKRQKQPMVPLPQEQNPTPQALAKYFGGMEKVGQNDPSQSQEQPQAAEGDQQSSMKIGPEDAQGGIPTLEQMRQELSSKYRSVSGWSDSEVVAVHFKTIEAIKPYLVQLKQMAAQKGQMGAVANTDSIKKTSWDWKLE